MPSVTLTAHACTIHARVHVPELSAWLPLTDPQVASAYEEAMLFAAACDFCLMLVQSLFQQQFPRLYQPSESTLS